MTVVETQADASFIGMENAETRLPARWAAAEARARNVALLFVLGATQLAWMVALGYFAYVFISS